MSLPHFFLEDQVISLEGQAVFPLRLTADDARHARVLRLAPGEHVAVIDAASDYFECCVEDAGESGVMVSVAQHLDAPERPCVVLLLGLSKGEKMDMVIRHATELGVSAFVPLACERSVVKLDERKASTRMRRWAAIAKSAAMQSGQPFVPEIAPVQSVAQAAASLSGATAVLVCWEEAPGTCTLRAALDRALEECPALDARVAVVVGPEGGLTEAEVGALLASNRHATLVSLGPSILRTETAGIVAPALVLYELEACRCE